LKNYSLAFRRDGQTVGFAEMARTKGQAIWQVLVRTDYEVEDLLDVREVFSSQFDKIEKVW
jgi:hypothetical protein